MLKQVNIVVKLLQTKGRLLHECRNDLSMLISAIEEEFNNTNSPLYMCQLGTKYVSSESDIV